ncbi:MAG: type II/IV secretion system protein [Planctomycetes bacterium]|nr:type II/IV secretion system protein [Planctomycetota bacterium]
MKRELMEKIKQVSSQLQKNLKNKKPETQGRENSKSVTETVPGLSEIYVPEQKDMKTTGDTPSAVRDIIDVLVEINRINPQQRTELRKKIEDLGDQFNADIKAFLQKSNVVDDDDILHAEAKLYNMEFRHIDPESVQEQVFKILHVDFIKANGIVPVSINDDTLLVATCEPDNIFALEDMKRQTKKKLDIVVCSPQDIKEICKKFESDENEFHMDEIIGDMTNVEVVQNQQEDFDDLEEMAGQSPVIKFVNYLITNAIRKEASDIHIEPKEKFTRIRYRVDGILFEIMQSPLKMHPAIVSRIKIMSNLDISERRLPQDGKISVIVGGRNVDLRISLLPTSCGEKAVIRVLDSKAIVKGLDQLGMTSEIMKGFSEQINMPHGIFLVTGPTGSGKSTTLYSAIGQMDGDKMNISTVEDPVEYQLGFCNQVQVNDRIGLTFASSLRSLLRQDPDIIMIGEIRDNETARIAVQSALTGHLVLSTLHTNDAPSSITRLVNIGIDDYLIAASLNGVLAQRLVRKICPDCKQQYKVSENVLKYAQDLGIDKKQLFHGQGCDKCRDSGYIGRIGIYELLVIDDNFRDMINKDHSTANMKRAFLENNGLTLFDDGIEKVKQGITTLDEVLRVTEDSRKNEDKHRDEKLKQ